MQHFRYVLGTFDATGLGHPCHAALCWQLRNGNLIVWGQVIDRKNTLDEHVIWGGSCFENLIEHFPRDHKARRMIEVFHRWNRNYLRRGTPAQENVLRQSIFPGYPTEYSAWAEAVLQNAGLLVDVVDEGKTRWRYGEGYMIEAIPPEIIAEINTWSRDPNVLEFGTCAEL